MRLARILFASIVCSQVIVGGVTTAGRSALAGGFTIAEQSASAAGTATAGAGALADDASTIFYNPAGMALLDGNQLLVSAKGFILDNQFSNRGTVDGVGNPIAGTEDFKNGIIPLGSLFGVLEVHERVKLGLGITSPFGLSSEYEDDWVGRYNTLLSGITTININPSIAVRVADWLSIGGGMSVQYAEGRRRNDLDFGTICFNELLGPGPCTGLGILPQGADGRLTIDASDWGIGYNLGVLIRPLPQTRVGLAYRSSIHQRLEGDADYDVPAVAAPLTFGGTVFQNTGATAEITFPASLSLSIYHELSPEFALLGDVTWTGWHSFETLRIEFDNPNQPDIVQEENWRDAFRYSIGLLYRPAESYVLRAGLAYDETPVRDSTRNPGIPGNDRLVFALGAGVDLTETISVDFAYTYNHELDAKVDAFRNESGTVSGEYQNRAHILSAQLRWRF
jgi:long-chain fatty acid transport protein